MVIFKDHRANMSRAARKSLFIRFILVMLLWQVIVHLVAQVAYLMTFVECLGHIGNLPTTFVLMLIAVCLCIVFEQLRMPTHLEFGPEGMRLHWLFYFGRKSSVIIPWKAIDSASVSEKSNFLDGMKQNLLRITVSRSMLLSRKTGLLRLASVDIYTAPFKSSKSREQWNFVFYDTKLCRERDSASIIDALKSQLDPGKLDPSIDTFIGQQDNQFTELWLNQLKIGCDRLDAAEPGDIIAQRFRIERRIGSGGQAITYVATDLQFVDSNHNDVDKSELGALPMHPTSDTANDGAPLNAIRYENPAVKQHHGTTKTLELQEAKNKPAPLVVLKEFVLPVTGGREVTIQALRRIEQEALLLQGLDHPQVVKCHELVCAGRRAYLVQNLIEGSSLQAIVKTTGPLAEQKVIKLALSMCDILDYIHSRTPPIVHRDFTPDNLMICDDSMLTLIDFNVAKQLESEDATQSVVGKHSYIPPEQFRGESCPQSDLYAMGCSLYYLLTGEEPEPISVARPKEKISEVSEGLNELVAKCTQQRLDRRYASAFEVKTDLAALCLSPVAE